jgi:hypothetical protein
MPLPVVSMPKATSPTNACKAWWCNSWKPCKPGPQTESLIRTAQRRHGTCRRFACFYSIFLHPADNQHQLALADSTQPGLHCALAFFSVFSRSLP